MANLYLNFRQRRKNNIHTIQFSSIAIGQHCFPIAFISIKLNKTTTGQMMYVSMRISMYACLFVVHKL